MKVTGKQQRAIGVLAAGGSRAQACEAAGVYIRTLERWLAIPGFREAIAQAQKDAADSLSDRWEKLAEEHFEAFRAVRQIVDLHLAPMLQKCLDAEKSGEPLDDVVNPSQVLKWVQALAIAVDGERTALAMNYLDSNRAVQHVQQLGYVVSEKGEAIDVESRQA
ncbi:MAG: hypothetical protein HC769_21735 [Cyanobacteria bacterium CRU_2_1]|nr:hypothetical protein [Cyanobacteria bacterium CRU_2_1]